MSGYQGRAKGERQIRDLGLRDANHYALRVSSKGMQ